MADDSPLSPSSPPAFQKAFHGLSRVRKMLEVFSHSVSNYIRTFLRRGLRTEDSEFNRDRSFSEGDVDVIRSISKEWSHSKSAFKLSDKTLSSHSSMMRPLSPYFRPITPSFRDDNFLDVPSSCSKSVRGLPGKSKSQKSSGENSRCGTPKYFGYGSEFDDIPWITTPRSVTSSEHSSSSHSRSKRHSPKTENNQKENQNGKPERPTSLLIPFTPSFNMTPQEFHLFNLRHKVWRSLYWQDAIKWEEDQATITRLLQLQEEKQNANPTKLQIPELNIPLYKTPAKSPILEDQSIISLNQQTLDVSVPAIMVTFTDATKTSVSTKYTPSFSSFSEAVQTTSSILHYTVLTESYTSLSDDFVNPLPNNDDKLAYFGTRRGSEGRSFKETAV